jgi:transposase
VPDTKILLAEMREARLKAEKHLAELREHGPGPAQRASDAVHEMVERMAANYHELEKAVADRVHLSREVLREWQNETRATMREITRVTASLAI